MKWIENSGAGDILANSGRPFDEAAYRTAVTEAYPRWRDATFAARADDGTLAAVALMKIAGVAESPPLGYGGVVSSRTLQTQELKSFLDAARGCAGVRSLRLRCVPDLDPMTTTLGATRVGTTSVVDLRSDESWRSRADPKALYSLRRAQGLAVEVTTSNNPAEFLNLYRIFADPEIMSPQKVAPRKVRHRDRLVEAVATAGIATFYEARLENRVVSAVAVLKGAGHWMAWLGAQDERGRAIHGGYVVLAAILDEAQGAGVAAVNLGSSTSTGGHPMPGVVRVKHRLGAVDLPIVEIVVSRRSAAVENWMRRRGSRRIRSF